MAALSPEEILANAINPAMAAVNEYGNEKIRFAQGQYARRLALEDAARREQAARDQLMLHGEISRKNALELESQHARHTLENEKAMAPIKAKERLEEIKATEQARINAMTAKEQADAVQRVGEAGIEQKPGESIPAYIFRGRQQIIANGANALRKFDSDKKNLQEKIDEIRQGDQDRLRKIAETGAATDVLSSPDLSKRFLRIFGTTTIEQLRDKMGKANVSLPDAIAALAKSDPKSAQQAQQIYQEALANRMAQVAELPSKASELAQREIGNLQSQQRNIDTLAATYIGKHDMGGAVITKYLEGNPDGGTLAPTRKAVFESMADEAAKTLTRQSPGYGVLRPGGPAPVPASTQPSASAESILAPPSASLVNSRNKERMTTPIAVGLRTPAELYDEAGVAGGEGPLTARDALSLLVAREQPKGGFMVPAPVTAKWHDTLATALGIEPENIGSSVFTRTPGDVLAGYTPRGAALRRKFANNDKEIRNRLEAMSDDEIEHLAAMVLGGPRTAPAPAPVQSMPVNGAALNPWILNSGFPALQNTPRVTPQIDAASILNLSPQPTFQPAIAAPRLPSAFRPVNPQVAPEQIFAPY